MLEWFQGQLTCTCINKNSDIFLKKKLVCLVIVKFIFLYKHKINFNPKSFILCNVDPNFYYLLMVVISEFV